MEGVKVYISNRQNEVKVPTGIRLLIRRCCSAVLAMEKFEGLAEVSVSFVSSEEIKQLNKQYRGRDIETDVLSFPLGENGIYDKNNETGAYMIGDIVICMKRALEQANCFGHTINREVGYLTVHAMLHLLGYDHEQGGIQAVHMREKEESVMSRIGLSRDTSYVLENE